MKLEFSLIVDTETGEFSIVSKDTGEIKEGKATTKGTRSKSKPKSDGSTIPQLILEENKYRLNSAAIELMGVEPDARLDIKIEREGGSRHPVLGTDEAFKTHSGNRLTKSYTVSCRGKNREQLETFGTIFNLIPHNKIPGLFILESQDGDSPTEVEDENIELPSNDASEDLPFDLGLDDIIENGDATETSALDFEL